MCLHVPCRSAEKDITRAHSLCPADKGIDREIHALHAQRRSALRDEKTIAVQMYGMGTAAGYHSNDRTSTQSTAGNDAGSDTAEYNAADLAEDEKQEMAQWSMPGSRGGAQRATSTATGNGDGVGGGNRGERTNNRTGGNLSNGGTTASSLTIMGMSCLNVATVSVR